MFLSDNNTKRKHIPHPPDYKIPLMPVNKYDEAYVLFDTKYSTHFPDNIMLIPNGIIPSQTNDPPSPSTAPGDTKVDQQSLHVASRRFTHHLIQIRSTVWHPTIKRRQITIITNTSTDNDGVLQYTVRPINNSTTVYASHASITLINPNSYNIPLSSKDIDNQLMTDFLLSEELALV